MAVYKSFQKFSLLLLYYIFHLNAGRNFLRNANLVSAQPLPLQARWCAPHGQYEQCQQLVNSIRQDSTYNGRITIGDNQQSNTGKAYSIELVCIYANHIYECVDLIYKNKADIARFSAEQLYALTTSTSQAHTSVTLLAAGATGPNSYIREYSNLVVKTVSNIKSIEDTKDRRACFGNVSHVHSPGYTASWIMPMYNAQSFKPFRKPSSSNCTTDLQIANELFASGACAPGFWAMDQLYASQYSTRLCASCLGQGASCAPNITDNDPLVCLSTPDRGELAFVSSQQIQSDFTGPNPKYNKNDYQLLCQQVNKYDFDVGNYATCNFGEIPEDAYIGMPNPDRLPSVFGKYIAQLFHSASSSTYPSLSFIADSRVVAVKPMSNVIPMTVNPFVSPQTYLMQFGNKVFYPAMLHSFPTCDKDTLRLCVDSVEETEKCEDMQLAFEAAGLPTKLLCLVGYSEDGCIKALNESNADLTMVSSHRADSYIQQQMVRPILSETYVNDDYAIAVTWANGVALSNFTTKIFVVCSSGADSFAGWEAPNMALQQLGLVARTCQLAESWSSVLTGACIPGVNNASATLGRGSDFPLTTNVGINLCKACGSSGPGTCKTPSEAPDLYHQQYDTYYGDVGALRCISRRNGNLAFIRSSAISTINTLASLGDPDFKKDMSNWNLLCADGRTTKPFNLDNVYSCNLGRVPNKWMVARNTDNEQLLRWQDNWMFAFGRARSDYNWLHTYIPYNLDSSSRLLDLIFSNNTRRLSRLNFRDTSLQDFHNMAFSDSNYKTPFVCRGAAAAVRFSLSFLCTCILFIFWKCIPLL